MLSLSKTSRNRPSRGRLRPAAIALILILAASAVVWAQRRPDFEGWHSQAAGMNQAIGIQRNEGRPMLVYFYADWCGFCRQFETELLTDDGVNDALKDLITVRINPENGPAERRLANMYGVSGYPALFVHSGESKTLSRIDRMKLDGGKPRLMTPDGVRRDRSISGDSLISRSRRLKRVECIRRSPHRVERVIVIWRYPFARDERRLFR